MPYTSCCYHIIIFLSLEVLEANSSPPPHPSVFPSSASRGLLPTVNANIESKRHSSPSGRLVWLSNYLLTLPLSPLALRYNKLDILISAYPQFRPVLKIQKNLKWSVHSIEIPTLVDTLKTQRLYKMNSKLWMTAPVEPLLNSSSDDCIALDLDKRLHARQMVGGHQTRLCPRSDRSNPIEEAVDFPKATYYFFLSNLY